MSEHDVWIVLERLNSGPWPDACFSSKVEAQEYVKRQGDWERYVVCTAAIFESADDAL